MSHIVRVNAGQKQIALPNGEVYDGQVDVTLTDAEFAQIRTALFPSVLTDLGSLADPAVDATFATDAELATGLADKVDVDSDPGSIIAESILSANYALTSVQTAIPNWQIVVPANSGPVEISAVDDLLVNIITGTNAAGTRFPVIFYLLDEANTVLTQKQWAICSSAAVAQTWSNTLPLNKRVLNNAAAKTYRVEAKMSLAGTNGATSTLFTSQQGAGFSDIALRAIRR